jgi:RND family efflux transporter MFP subunit
LTVTEGDALFAMRSRTSEGRTLAGLEAVETERAGELQLARDRLRRLEELLPVQAVSEADVEVARARVQAIEAQLAAARRDLTPARGGGDGGDRFFLRAPLTGKVADVRVSPGEAATAGQVLGRLVAVEPVWVSVYLAARDAARLGQEVARLWLRAAGQQEPVRFDSVRMVAVSPAVDDRTGRVECLLEVARVPEDLRIGSAVEVEITGADVHEGIVIPTSALVDDAGTPVVYVQRTGESFSRVVVEVLGREGGRLLVRGVTDGDRVVTVGGNAIRRASLVGSGVGHGHVH